MKLTREELELRILALEAQSGEGKRFTENWPGEILDRMIGHMV